MPVRSEYYLNLPGELTIGVTSNRELELTASDELLLGAYLPEVGVTQSSTSADVMVHHTQSADGTLRTGNGEVEINDQWGDTMPSDLPHLLYSIARGLWLQRGYFPTHAACVGQENHTLLPGHSGVGKTTTALTAVTNFGQKILSGNTTLLRFDGGSMQAVAGTRTMTLRTEDFEKGTYPTARSLEYGDRTAFELAPNLQASTPKNIGRVALVRLSSGMQASTKLSELSALHKLYPYFLDTEYADCIVAGGRAVFLGDTPRRAREDLVAKLGRSIKGISVIEAIGDKRFLAEKAVTV
jgi:hypothetical protein